MVKPAFLRACTYTDIAQVNVYKVQRARVAESKRQERRELMRFADHSRCRNDSVQHYLRVTSDDLEQIYHTTSNKFSWKRTLAQQNEAEKAAHKELEQQDAAG